MKDKSDWKAFGSSFILYPSSFPRLPSSDNFSPISNTSDNPMPGPIKGLSAIRNPDLIRISGTIGKFRISGQWANPPGDDVERPLPPARKSGQGRGAAG
jgi:hypothetical protein